MELQKEETMLSLIFKTLWSECEWNGNDFVSYKRNAGGINGKKKEMVQKTLSFEFPVLSIILFAVMF